MGFFAQYGLFLLKIVTIMLVILIVPLLGVMLKTANKDKDEGTLTVKNINDKFDEMQEAIIDALPKEARKIYYKKQKEEKKKAKKEKKRKATENGAAAAPTDKRRIYVLNFDGDTKASAADALREEVSAILSIATARDEVLVMLESYGGAVHQYGFAASQLQRLRDNHIPLTVSIDRVAASGGYLMACVANTIVAAPFAIIGSIGVIAQLPNFSRLLKHNRIEFQQLTAGDYKRTLNLLAPNTREGIKKASADVEAVHTLFKSFIQQYRPQVPIEAAATGEYWHANDERVKELQLIDQLITGTEYLRRAKNNADIYELCYKRKEKLAAKLTNLLRSSLKSTWATLHELNEKSRFI